MNRREVLTWAGVAGAAAAAGAGVSWWRQGDLGPAAVADTFWTQRFTRPEGGELALASLKGQVLVLNFWATWCPPCVREMPEFERFHKARAAQGVQVVGLAVDGPTPVRQFLARQPVSYAIGLAGFEGTELSRQLGNEGGALPFTVVFDRSGALRHRKLGQTGFAELESWVNSL